MSGIGQLGRPSISFNQC